MDKKVEVGMELTVREDLMDLVMDDISDVVFDMVDKAGKKVTIATVISQDRFEICEDGCKWFWYRNLFEELR